MKKLISWVIAIPALIIFCSEAEIQFLGVQLLAGLALFGILFWNGATYFNQINQER